MVTDGALESNDEMRSSFTNRERHARVGALHPGWSPAVRKNRWRKVRTPQGSVPHDECGQRRRKSPLTESVAENIPPEAGPGFGIPCRQWSHRSPVPSPVRVKWRVKSPPPRAVKPGAGQTPRGARQTGKTGRLPDPRSPHRPRGYSRVSRTWLRSGSSAARRTSDE